MALLNGLTDTCDIYGVVYTKTASGEEVKTFVLSHSALTCRLMKSGSSPRSRQTRGQFEENRSGWTMLIPPEITGVLKGWKIEVNGLVLFVNEVHPIRGDTSEIHHHTLFLQEKE
jgi:hypothetical protein